jgi:indolepyruvate ferredoxin oxidoreductase, beta subunit
LKTINILLAGVGGQGIVSASDILADMALARGYDVKKSEIHGMSQRGGVVSSFVRFGDEISSPIPFKEEIDYIVSFEEMESLRWPDYINENTKVIVNLKRIKPATLADVKAGYPDAKTGIKTKNAYFLEASEEAKKIGNEKVESSVMLGALCSFIGFKEAEFEVSLKKKMKKYIAENMAAFKKGEEFVR